MRTAEEHPATVTEQTIFDLLVENGIKPEEIQFRGGPNHSHGGRRYLRVGYWQRLKPELYQQLEVLLTEDDDYDDDCGYLFSYHFRVQTH
jgi:hypothetical protein